MESLALKASDGSVPDTAPALAAVNDSTSSAEFTDGDGHYLTNCVCGCDDLRTDQDNDEGIFVLHHLHYTTEKALN